MPPLLSLALASATLVATHLALSHPLRAPLVRRLGERGFLLLYSAVALGAVWWMARAFRSSPPGDFGAASGITGWIGASVLTLLATVLFLGSLRGNPALPQAAGTGLAGPDPHGVYRVTRHPMMWSFALWALAHLALLWSWRTTIVAGAVLLLALVGAAGQDRRKARTVPGWPTWAGRTSFQPRWRELPAVGWPLWLAAAGTWLLATGAHGPLGGVPAGIWHWMATG